MFVNDAVFDLVKALFTNVTELRRLHAFPAQHLLTEFTPEAVVSRTRPRGFGQCVIAVGYTSFLVLVFLGVFLLAANVVVAAEEAKIDTSIVIWTDLDHTTKLSLGLPFGVAVFIGLAALLHRAAPDSCIRASAA